jgi:hypothetical protein
MSDQAAQYVLNRFVLAVDLRKNCWFCGVHTALPAKVTVFCPATLHSSAHFCRKRWYRHTKPQCHTAHDSNFIFLIIQPATQHVASTNTRKNDNTVYFLAISNTVFAEFWSATLAPAFRRVRNYTVILRHTLLIRPPSCVKICDATNNTRWAAARSRPVAFCSNRPPNGSRQNPKTK